MHSTFLSLSPPPSSVIPQLSSSRFFPSSAAARWPQALVRSDICLCFLSVSVQSRCVPHTRVAALWQGYSFDTSSAALREILDDACQVILNVRGTPFLPHSPLPTPSPTLPILSPQNVSARVRVRYDIFRWVFFGGTHLICDGLCLYRVGASAYRSSVSVSENCDFSIELCRRTTLFTLNKQNLIIPVCINGTFLVIVA